MNSVLNETYFNGSDPELSSYCHLKLPGFTETILFCSLNSINGFSAMAGNLLVLMAIYCTRQLWTTHNIFISSMASADFLVGLLMNPLYIAIAVLKVWVSEHVLFTMESFLWIQTLAATTFSLSAVSVDRYLAVTSPIKHRVVVTPRRCKIVVGVIWISSFVLASLLFFMETQEQKETLFFTTQILTVGVPLVIICYCYVAILKTVRFQNRRKIGNENTRREAQENAKHRKTALTIAIIISIFLVVFTPNFVFSVLVFTVSDPCQQLVYYRDWYWAAFIVFISSAMNPWIYAMRLRGFRKAMKRTVSNVFICSVFNSQKKPSSDIGRNETNGSIDDINV